MKKRMKTIVKFALLLTGLGLVAKLGSTAYFNAFGGPTTAPKTVRDHWTGVKQTFPETASDMDSDDIIQERRADIT
jgi:hypothetical protein